MKLVKEYPLVTVITPTYNHKKFIGKCIESVLGQTYPRWELIIVDDGSTDGTDEIVKQYKDERIKYIRQEHLGILKLADTYNKALNISRGEYISVLEGDDFWDPWKIEKQITVFKKKDIVLSFGMAVRIDDKDESLGVHKLKNAKLLKNKSQGALITELLRYSFSITACTVMCRKNALLSIEGFKQMVNAPHVDYPTWLELSLIGKFEYTPEILGYWRVHGGQATSRWILETAQGDSFAAIDFFNRMPKEIRDATNLTKNDILKYNQRHIAIAYYSIGRLSLVRKDWQKAQEEFLKALWKGSLPTKLKVLLGIICSYLCVDFEWIVKIFQRPYLK